MIPINPKTKVAELLDAYPALEPVLIDLAPPFRKLRNPVLRRTIARVTSLARAAEVAGIPVREIVIRLREAAGLETPDPTEELGGPEAGEDRPADWVDPARVRWTIEADLLLDGGQQPIVEVQKRAATLAGDDLGLVRSSFRPAPLVEVLEKRGFRVAVLGSGGSFATFIAARSANGFDV